MQEYINKNIRLVLSDYKAYPWICSDNVRVRGYIFIDGNCLKDGQLLDYFRNISGADDALDRIERLDGFFSLIAKLEDSYFIAVDHLRSMPVFVVDNPDEIIITDSFGEDAIKKNGLDSDAMRQFHYSLYVIGHKTLLKNAIQLPAGHYCIITNTGPELYQYWRYSYGTNQITDMSEGLELIDNSYMRAFQNLITLLNGRTAVIPLSGGHDSRLIAYYLTKLGYKNIIAFSYGRKNNKESYYAEKVANALGIPYHFAGHTRTPARRWMKKYFKQYALYFSNAVSVPVMHGPYAVYRLLEENIIDRTCVIVPGFTGDFPAGYYVPLPAEDSTGYAKETLIENLCRMVFDEGAKLKQSSKDYAVMKQKIERLPYIASSKETLSYNEYTKAYEECNLMERQAKHLQNHLRCYDYFGLEWATPFFDRQQFDVWGRIDNTLRYNRRLFFELENTIYPDDLQAIPFSYGQKKQPLPLIKKIKKQLRIIAGKFLLPYDWHFQLVFIPFHTFVYNYYIKRNKSIYYNFNAYYAKLLRKLSASPRNCRK